MRSQRRLPCGVLVLGLLAALGCKAPSPSASADEVARAPTLAGVAASALASPTADAAVASPAAADTALLRIHQINVHQGDCTPIVGPDGTTFLIDAGNPGVSPAASLRSTKAQEGRAQTTWKPRACSRTRPRWLPAIRSARPTRCGPGGARDRRARAKRAPGAYDHMTP